jgi:hypothetical protein
MPSEDDPLVRANARVGTVLNGGEGVDRLFDIGVASVDAASRHGRGERSS